MIESDGADAIGIAAISRWSNDSDTPGIRPETAASFRDASKRSKCAMKRPLHKWPGIPMGCSALYASLWQCRCRSTAG